MFSKLKNSKYVILLITICFQEIFANLIILSPSELKNQFPPPINDINFTIAKFGHIPYGQKLSGRLHYVNNLDACKTLSASDYKFSGTENDPQNYPVLLINRGKCTLATKARNAELVGAKIVIIADNKDEDISKVVLANNGLGYNINILCDS